jgi:hypothetical protein
MSAFAHSVGDGQSIAASFAGGAGRGCPPRPWLDRQSDKNFCERNRWFSACLAPLFFPRATSRASCGGAAPGVARPLFCHATVSRPGTPEPAGQPTRAAQEAMGLALVIGGL